MMEPWDGPAAMVFTDGRQIAATLDRNGLRPARYTATFDNALELLTLAGYPMAQAAMMMIPGSLGGQHPAGRPAPAFYEYHASMMEPWDGPAAMVFTDGRQIAATLDRNGLRPARY
ncbi:hypothetical protein CTI14_54155, partial [Methylobacterium radiotolerans]